MAKTRSLPDKYYDKDYEHNGIHRVPLWRIACFALNNTATNLYMMMMGYATYYLMCWGCTTTWANMRTSTSSSPR